MGVTDGSMGPVEMFLRLLPGKNCWSIIAGPGTGSMVSIALGRQIPRQRPIKNPTLSALQREFDGEFKVFIQDADWRLEDRGEAICSNEDTNDADGPMLSGLNRLVGKTVVSAAPLGKGGDFELIFDENLRLLVLCASSSDASDDGANYSLHDLEKVVAVIGNGQVVVEPKHKQTGADSD